MLRRPGPALLDRADQLHLVRTRCRTHHRRLHHQQQLTIRILDTGYCHRRHRADIDTVRIKQLRTTIHVLTGINHGH